MKEQITISDKEMIEKGTERTDLGTYIFEFEGQLLRAIRGGKHDTTYKLLEEEKTRTDRL